MRSKQVARLQDPEYRAAQLERAKNKQITKQKTTSTRQKPLKTKTKATSKGLKGRAPTAAEREVMDSIGKLPCVCCLLKGRFTPLISLHHMDGRTKPYAHMMTLPLCAYHHDTPADKSTIEEYPDLIPYHARGLAGGKKAWSEQNGDGFVLLAMIYQAIGFNAPFVLPDIPNDCLPGIDLIRNTSS
ncbi:recombination enhancement function protein [Photobacterium aphoticum]|uniref:Recombination enhancement function protein n=1 Tax=Photobacterium aphoticum TaxID=754436 RepID=A0A090RKA7_9GAMM|nr:recombination enhancement function protein [Photobacterium aphoticum]